MASTKASRSAASKKAAATRKKKKESAAQPASVSDKPEPQTTVVEDPESVGEVVPTDDPNLDAVLMADSTKSPPQPQTAYYKPKDD